MLTSERERAYFADDDECWCDWCEQPFDNEDTFYSPSQNMTFCNGCRDRLTKGAAEELAIGLEGLIVWPEPMMEAAE